MAELKPEIAQKEPYAIECEPGQYWWCACGRSQNQPFCDSSHKTVGFKSEVTAYKLDPPKPKV